MNIHSETKNVKAILYCLMCGDINLHNEPVDYHHYRSTHQHDRHHPIHLGPIFIKVDFENNIETIK